MFPFEFRIGPTFGVAIMTALAAACSAAQESDDARDTPTENVEQTLELSLVVDESHASPDIVTTVEGAAAGAPVILYMSSTPDAPP